MGKESKALIIGDRAKEHTNPFSISLKSSSYTVHPRNRKNPDSKHILFRFTFIYLSLDRYDHFVFIFS